MTFWLGLLREGESSSKFSGVEEGPYGEQARGGDGYIEGIDKLPEQLEPSLSMLGPMSPPEPAPLANPEPEPAPDEDEATTSDAATTGSGSRCTRDLAILLQDMSYISIHIYSGMHLRAWRRAEGGGHVHAWTDG
jgi:hypothetical protein